MGDFVPMEYWQERLRRRCDWEGVGCLGVGRWYNWWLYRIRRRVFFRVAARMRLSGKPIDVCDVGSGTGFYIKLWKEVGVRTITGNDLTKVAVEHLRYRFPDTKCVHADITDEGMIRCSEFGRYDVISAFDVLFHIVDDNRYRAALRNIRALLRDGGAFVFSENFLHSPSKGSDHQVSRSVEDITGKLREAGFEIIDRLPMFMVMNQPVDSNGRVFRLWWRCIAAAARRSEVLGLVIGLVLYPVEVLLTAWSGEGPSTEVMICVGVR